MQANFLQVTLVKLWFYKTKQLADFRKFWLFWLPHSVFDVFCAVSSFFFVILLFSDPPYIPPPPVNQVSQWPSQFQAYPSLPCLFFLFCHVLCKFFGSTNLQWELSFSFEGEGGKCFLSSPSHSFTVFRRKNEK